MNPLASRRRFCLNFPAHLTDQPVLYRVVRDFDLAMNILQARVLPDRSGIVILELQGPDEGIGSAVSFLEQQGIEVTEQERALGWDADACVDCGFCLPFCEPQALHRVAGSQRVTLERATCTLCGRCVEVCAYGAVWMEE
ncbi:MAG: NIL domain-containing protein [Chloroflexia bacterium]